MLDTPSDNTPPIRELHVLSLQKGQEKYIFVYEDASAGEVIEHFCDSAQDPALSLNWFDAMVLTQKVRAAMQNTQRE